LPARRKYFPQSGLFHRQILTAARILVPPKLCK
jgi:hypothetical protein